MIYIENQSVYSEIYSEKAINIAVNYLILLASIIVLCFSFLLKNEYFIQTYEDIIQCIKDQKTESSKAARAFLSGEKDFWERMSPKELEIYIKEQYKRFYISLFFSF